MEQKCLLNEPRRKTLVFADELNESVLPMSIYRYHVMFQFILLIHLNFEIGLNEEKKWREEGNKIKWILQRERSNLIRKNDK